MPRRIRATAKKNGKPDEWIVTVPLVVKGKDKAKTIETLQVGVRKFLESTGQALDFDISVSEEGRGQIDWNYIYDCWGAQRTRHL